MVKPVSKSSLLAVTAFFSVSSIGFCQDVNGALDNNFIENNTFGFVLGNPQNGLNGLKKIYVYINVYRNNNQGRYPAQVGDLHADIMTYPSKYGFKNFIDADNALVNPDTIYADFLPFRQMKKPSIAYFIANTLPNGKPVGTPKSKGTSAAISWTDIYSFSNTYKVRSRNFQNPVGYWQVLWDDGTVESVPFDLMVYMPNLDGFYTTFPHQNSIKFDSVNYEEYRTKITDVDSVLIGKPISPIDKEVVIDNGGPESLLILSRQINYPNRYGIDREDLWKQFDPVQAEFTLPEVQLGAKKLGIDTQVQKLPLSQLQESGSSALLFLKDDGRIVALTAVDDDRAVVVDRGQTRNVERSVLEARYSGEALIPTKALTQNTNIVVDNAVRELQLPSLEAEVPQQFTLRNTGTTPVTLQLEYPLLGVTESKLSKDTLASGETATLDLKVKWRSILKAPTQNVLVSLQTSDPIVPRLQLAILLVPPQSTNAK